MTQAPQAKKKDDPAKSRTVRVRQQVGPVGLAERASAVSEWVGGGSKMAELLGVSKSQPTRWSQGREQPSLSKAREIVDLDHLVARAALLWEPRVVQAWLTGSNGYLEGARPIDVLRTRGVSEVLEALEAETQAAFG